MYARCRLHLYLCLRGEQRNRVSSESKNSWFTHQNIKKLYNFHTFKQSSVCIHRCESSIQHPKYRIIRGHPCRAANTHTSCRATLFALAVDRHRVTFFTAYKHPSSLRLALNTVAKVPSPRIPSCSKSTM